MKKIQLITLLTTLAFQSFSMNTGDIFELDLSDLSNYNFTQIEEGLMRSENKSKNITIEIAYGRYAIKARIDELKDQLANISVDRMKYYEYDYRYNKLLEELESFELALEKLEKDPLIQSKYGSWNSTNYTCAKPLYQRYTSYPMMWGAGFSVRTLSSGEPGPFPPTTHPVDVLAVATFYPGQPYKKVDMDASTAPHIYAVVATANVVSGFTLSGTQIPFEAKSTLHDKFFMGLFGCYTTITVVGTIESSY